MSIIGSSKARATNKSEFFQDVASVATYSPQGEYFLYLSLAVDKHRLRVYDTGSGKAVADHVVDNGRITSTCWHRVEEAILQDGGDGEGNPRKRRKKSSKKTNAAEPGKTALVAILGLSNGTLLLFSPARNHVTQTISQAASTAAVLSVAASVSDPSKFWASSADGCIREWDLSSSKVVGTWQQADRTPFSSIALRPVENKDGNTQVLAAHHTISLLSLQATTSPSTTDIQQPVVLATFTGHASPVTSLQWDPTALDRFISIAENDRIGQVWKLSPTNETGSGRLVATIPLDSSVRSLGFPGTSASRTVFALSDSGNLSLLSLPAKLGNETKRGNSQVKSLQAQCAVSVKAPAAGSTSSSAPIVAAQFAEALPGHINIARVVSMRPLFDVIRFADDDGSFVPEVHLEHEPIGAFHEDGGETGIDRPRYSDKAARVRSGAALPESADFDNEPEGIDAELDADMAELTLGQRLKALNADRRAEGEGEGPSDTEGVHRSDSALGGRLSGITLTRTLTQALHSNDKQLLETCLQTADERIVKGTVEGLLQQHVIPLLDMLVERLAKGGSGGVGGASTDYAATIVVWIRVVLFVHAAFLLTQPDLVKKLASLHATLVARSALQDRLQMLNGRLDLIFSQLRMRRYDAAGSSSGKSRRKAMLYVEGDSSEEEETGMDVDGDVEIEDDDDDGSIEDVELGGLGDEARRFREEETSDEDEDEDESDELEEDESDSDLAGFIDDEAEESEGDGDGSDDVSEEEE
ncbi:Small subunit (SSU) processome component [Tulasnella sp. 424]|nr:Small subunit (SSU) processome component [Tulasnella sp. 424]KAG8981177.1 Small subunit (SSU) processome component [Tulasnella sp. 425]